MRQGAEERRAVLAEQALLRTAMQDAERLARDSIARVPFSAECGKRGEKRKGEKQNKMCMRFARRMHGAECELARVVDARLSIEPRQLNINSQKP